MFEMIRPSDVTRSLVETPWHNSERETVATVILKMSRFENDDQWQPFTWADYVRFRSHVLTQGEKAILDEFVDMGYLSRGPNDTYVFKRKIIGVYMQYCE